MSKIFTVSIIGCGSRGHDAYGKCICEMKDKFRIVSVCDINPIKLGFVKKEWGIAEENLFLDENEFFKKKALGCARYRNPR